MNVKSSENGTQALVSQVRVLCKLFIYIKVLLPRILSLFM